MRLSMNYSSLYDYITITGNCERPGAMPVMAGKKGKEA